ncbi:hypothetical protein D9757_005126 [Collybiopsis confluens]|uniref:Uncharacterized protein n=1 Tax=Collybiopsis confluens TaxID=2823264 RepID=A0A8H5HT45_9AGAR|nr:hypothetical protein D9757_005126 [Collybiopsis confluens]
MLVLQAFAPVSDSCNILALIRGYVLGPGKEEQMERAKEKQSSLQDRACPLEKYPLQDAVTTVAGKLICPASIDHPKTKKTEVPYTAGENLFRLAWRHYSQTVASDEQLGWNYVNADGIAIRRRTPTSFPLFINAVYAIFTDEYLGPSPAVAGFVVEDGKTIILFYDHHLGKAWSTSGVWKILPCYKDESWILLPDFEDVAASGK